MLRKLLLIGAIAFTTILSANDTFQEPTTGVEIIWSQDGQNWEKIIARGEADLRFGDRKDVRQSTQKALMRAKASIAKFLNEKLKSSETMDEMTKTMTEINDMTSSASRKSVEVLIEKISNSAKEILKGVLVLEQNINQKEKYVVVTAGMSRKTMRTADSMKNTIRQDLSRPKQTQQRQYSQYNNGSNEIRRSKNYDNF